MGLSAKKKVYTRMQESHLLASAKRVVTCKCNRACEYTGNVNVELQQLIGGGFKLDVPLKSTAFHTTILAGLAIGRPQHEVA